MLTPIEKKIFSQNLHSIKLAYRIGVFSKEYAINKISRLYAQTFGVCSAIYQEMTLDNWEECLCD